MGAEKEAPGGASAGAATRVEVVGNPDFGSLDCHLAPGDTLLVEGGAMAAMSAGMQVDSRLMGGFFRAAIRRMFGGESLFVGAYSHPDGGFLSVSPAVPGRVVHRRLQGETLILQAGSFLACSPTVDVATRFGGLRSFFSGEGAFFLECGGAGDLYFNAYGDVLEKDVTAPFVVDTGHVVGWESTLEWTIRGMGGMKSTMFSGEGLVLEFTGRGKVWVQTRTQAGFGSWLSGYMR